MGAQAGRVKGFQPPHVNKMPHPDLGRGEVSSVDIAGKALRSIPISAMNHWALGQLTQAFPPAAYVREGDLLHLGPGPMGV